MDEHRRQDARLGLFVLIALAILIAGSLWIAGSAIFGGVRPTYDVLMYDSAGIRSGDRVRVAGVSVGRVRGVDLRPGDEWPVVFRIAIRSEVVLHRDASAAIASAGLLGAGFLQLDPGSPEQPTLDAGAEIRGTKQMGIDSALARADEMAAKLGALIDRATGTLDELLPRIVTVADRAERLISEENAENLQEILGALRATVDEGRPLLLATMENMSESTAKLGQTVDGLPELSARLDGILAGVESALGPDGRRLTDLLESTRSTLDSADASLGVLGDNRDELSAALEDLAATLTNLKAFTRQIKEQPYSLVRIRHPPDRRPGDGAPEEDR